MHLPKPEDIERWAGALSKLARSLGIQTAAGRVLYGVEVSLAILVLIPLFAFLLEDFIKWFVLILAGQAAESHSFLGILLYFGMILASIGMVFIREILELRRGTPTFPPHDAPPSLPPGSPR